MVSVVLDGIGTRRLFPVNIGKENGCEKLMAVRLGRVAADNHCSNKSNDKREYRRESGRNHPL